MRIAKEKLRLAKFAFCSGCEDSSIHIATHYYFYNDKITLSVCKKYLAENKIKESSIRVRKIIKES